MDTSLDIARASLEVSVSLEHFYNLHRHVVATDAIWALFCHRLNGSASPVLTATHHSYRSPRLYDFFRLPLEVRPLNQSSRKMAQTTWIHVKNVPFALKVAIFHTPWSPGPLKGHNLEIFELRKFSLDFAFNIRGHEENPHSSSEPNKSVIVNGQIGWEIKICT